MYVVCVKIMPAASDVCCYFPFLPGDTDRALSFVGADLLPFPGGDVLGFVPPFAGDEARPLAAGEGEAPAFPALAPLLLAGDAVRPRAGEGDFPALPPFFAPAVALPPLFASMPLPVGFTGEGETLRPVLLAAALLVLAFAAFSAAAAASAASAAAKAIAASSRCLATKTSICLSSSPIINCSSISRNEIMSLSSATPNDVAK